MLRADLSLAKNFMSTDATNVTFETVLESDFEELVDFRMAAMRESLERVGRFDPTRARERLRSTFLTETQADENEAK